MAYNNVKVKARQVVTKSQQTKDLGIVTNVPMGEWQADVPYEKLNMVRSHNATYQAKKANKGIEPTVTAGWQEVWQVVAYDGNAVIPTGTYPEMTVGNATNAQNDGTGENIAGQFKSATIALRNESEERQQQDDLLLNDINAVGDKVTQINQKIPSAASQTNQLADKAFVNSSINNMAAFYITYNVTGSAFPTRASLLGATTFYSGGQTRVPTQNDYAIVLADESQPKGIDGTYPTTRYSYQGGVYPNGQWDFQYIVNNTSLTQAQVDAINSGITPSLVTKLDGIADGATNTKVKGNAETSYRTGNVNITPANVGAVNKTGDSMTGQLSITPTIPSGQTKRPAELYFGGDHRVEVSDSRNEIAKTPAQYYGLGSGVYLGGLWANANSGLSGFSFGITFCPWADKSGGDVVQIALNGNAVYCRHGNADTWSSWAQFTTLDELSNKVSKSGDTMTGKLTLPKLEIRDKSNIEINPDAVTPYIDFHYANSTKDYTSRIIETSEGVLNVQAQLNENGQRVYTKGTLTFSTSGSTLTITNTNT